eukprot:PhM_4_TR3078/c0_g1_i8/m.102651
MAVLLSVCEADAVDVNDDVTVPVRDSVCTSDFVALDVKPDAEATNDCVNDKDIVAVRVAVFEDVSVDVSVANCVTLPNERDCVNVCVRNCVGLVDNDDMRVNVSAVALGESVNVNEPVTNPVRVAVGDTANDCEWDSDSRPVCVWVGVDETMFVAESVVVAVVLPAWVDENVNVPVTVATTYRSTPRNAAAGAADVPPNSHVCGSVPAGSAACH